MNYGVEIMAKNQSDGGDGGDSDLRPVKEKLNQGAGVLVVAGTLFAGGTAAAGAWGAVAAAAPAIAAVAGAAAVLGAAAALLPDSTSKSSTSTSKDLPDGGVPEGSDAGGGDGGGGGGGGDGGGGDGDGGCFVGNTPVVLADNTTQPIEKVRAGDHVLSLSENVNKAVETAKKNGVLLLDKKTSNAKAQKVLRTWIHNVKETLLLHLSNGEKIETTAEHRFFVFNQGFVAAGNLTVGTRLRTCTESSVQVIQIEYQSQPAVVYNLTVDDFQTYFVGQVGVLVHNVKNEQESNNN